MQPILTVKQRRRNRSGWGCPVKPDGPRGVGENRACSAWHPPLRGLLFLTADLVLSVGAAPFARSCARVDLSTPATCVVPAELCDTRSLAPSPAARGLLLLGDGERERRGWELCSAAGLPLQYRPRGKPGRDRRSKKTWDRTGRATRSRMHPSVCVTAGAAS